MTRKKDYNEEHPEPGVEEGAEREPGTKVEDPAKLAEELERARAREDELLRAVAELTNVNRRRKQDMESIAQLSQESLVRSLLPVLDDIDRAISASKGREGDAFHSGLLMIRDRLWQVLSREGLEPIDALGAAFDPELHEAVAQRPSEDRPPGTVLEVIVPGCRIRERVLRHAQVVVAGPRQDAYGGSTGAGQANTARDAGGSGF
jgi:molecular chaperone GrpE